MSKELEKAREYEQREAALISDDDRPVFHLTPRVGWLNDPNGFSYYDDKYHLFYQYHPYSNYWGPMHWGHAVSDDMISWEYLPAALAPDKDYDSEGCFSGTAITLPDGRQMLMYTGVADDGKDPLGRGRWKQTQCIAVSDPETGEYVKYEGNPVITEEDLPEQGDPYEFRDPYLWRSSDGTYRAVVANGTAGEISHEGSYIHEKGTQLCVYRSDDGFEWSFDRVLFEDDRHIGIMWECPNSFKLGGRHMLIASPMDMQLEEESAEGTVRFPKGNNVCYITGSFDEKSGTFRKDLQNGRFRYEPVDMGLDFYAPQVMQTPDGRHVMIGWMQDPATANYISKSNMTGEAIPAYLTVIEEADGYEHGEPGSRIFGQMTVPRELTLRGDRLIQWPIRELEEYRSDRAIFISTDLDSETKEFAEISGRALDMTLEISPAFSSVAGGCSLDEFRLRFAEDSDHFTELIYRPDSSTVTVDRSRSGQCSEISKRRSIRVRNRRGSINIRMLLDKWSAEIFINGGEQVMTLTYYTPEAAKGISFSAEGSAVMDITAYNMHRCPPPQH